MRSFPLVTVIIPTYNSSGTLRLSLESVLLQDFAEFEVWVVGDGCSDDTASVVESFADKRIHWTNLPDNSGSPSAPRNEGLRHATGELIAYLGHDDLWFPWHLSELTGCLQSGNRAEFAYSLGVLLAPTGATGCFALPEDLSKSGYISPSNWMHRKSLIDKIGPWAQKVKFGDDREFLRRVFTAGTPVQFRRQLTVLKYPAAAWRMYSLASNYPQSNQLNAIRRDPETLRLNLLLEIAGRMVGGPSSPPTHHLIPLPRWVRKLLPGLLDWYGRDRWPIDTFEHWRWRRLTGLADKRDK
ncbi:MAG: glycosyltransferase family 2 protein [Acidobacteria bacterium]|nr:MAG: glycosyltransferase family 2 protein [Acidobacteriota bacterium]